jgi:hypothetical protein
LKQKLRDQGIADESYAHCDQKGELLALLSTEERKNDGPCDGAQVKGNGFRRPFKLLSDHDIMSFLDVNEIPSEIDDVRFLRYVNDHERLVKGLFLPFLFDQRVTLFFFRYHHRCDSSGRHLRPTLQYCITLCHHPTRRQVICVHIYSTRR